MIAIAVGSSLACTTTNCGRPAFVPWRRPRATTALPLCRLGRPGTRSSRRMERSSPGRSPKQTCRMSRAPARGHPSTAILCPRAVATNLIISTLWTGRIWRGILLSVASAQDKLRRRPGHPRLSAATRVSSCPRVRCVLRPKLTTALSISTGKLQRKTLSLCPDHEGAYRLTVGFGRGGPQANPCVRIQPLGTRSPHGPTDTVQLLREAVEQRPNAR